MDDDQKPKEQQPALTPEDLEFDAKLKKALEDYQKEHPEYKP